VTIIGEHLYRHHILRINYTTYDVQRSQDSINPCTHPDIMVLSCDNEMDEDAHPYWYGRVIGVYHIEVRHTGPLSKQSSIQHLEVLHIHWFEVDCSYLAGFKARRPY
jgi:hypothetical protein